MKDSDRATPQEWVTPGLARRLAAICYDSFLVAAILLVAIALVVVPLNLIYGGENFNAGDLRSNPFYIAYLFCVMAGFHILFWIRGGQTLGMRSWRLRVVRIDGQGLGFKDAMLRYLAAMLSLAALGLGFLWVLVDKDKLAWHDRVSKTQLVLTEKKQT
jgi:uncharacterized RDD family membrane protein YckC